MKKDILEQRRTGIPACRFIEKACRYYENVHRYCGEAGKPILPVIKWNYLEHITKTDFLKKRRTGILACRFIEKACRYYENVHRYCGQAGKPILPVIKWNYLEHITKTDFLKQRRTGIPACRCI